MMTDTDKIFGFYDASLNNGAIKLIAERLPNNSTIVELGTMFGRSAIAWADIMRALNKACKIYTLDRFDLSPQYVLTEFTYLYGRESVWPFIINECSHLDMVRKIIEPYPEIEPVVCDFQTVPDNIKNVDCIYYDGWHYGPNLSTCIANWISALNENGIFSGQYYHLEGVENTLNSLNLKIVVPKEDSTVYYLAHK
jgi:hypothetical protein